MDVKCGLLARREGRPGRAYDLTKLLVTACELAEAETAR